MSPCVLYPSYSFENLSYSSSNDESISLLAAWSAIFHPAVICSTRSNPRFESAYYPPSSEDVTLIVVPPSCEEMISSDWVTQREAAGVRFIRHHTQRDEILTALLDSLPGAESYSDELVALCLALGTCSFFIERLTRQMRYMSMLDHGKLRACVVRAAETSQCDELRVGFEHLLDTQDNFCGPPPHLLDLRLCSGQLSQLPLSSTTPWSLIASPESLAEFDTELLRDAVQSKTLAVAGSDDAATAATLTPLVTLIDLLHRGREDVARITGQPPQVFARLLHGVSPLFPRLLRLCGYRGVLHFLPLGGWKLGEHRESAMLWVGADGTTIPAVTRYPLNAAANDVPITLPDLMQTTMNGDRVPTLPIALLAGETSFWLDDLRLAAMTMPETRLIGEFRTLDDYVERMSDSAPRQSYPMEKYRSRTDTALDTDLVSRSVSAFRAAARDTARSGRDTITAIVGTEMLTSSAANFDTPQGWIIINEWSFPRTVTIDDIPEISEPVELPPFGFAVVQKNSTQNKKTLPPITGNVNENIFLENEFFRAVVDTTTGHLTSLTTSRIRGNRLASFLAMRLSADERRSDTRSPSDPNFGYTISAADSVNVITNTNLCSAIEVAGRLVCPAGRLAATFIQQFTVRRGSRIIDVTATLTPQILPESALWDNYYAVRFGWRNEFLTPRAGIHGGLYPWNDDLVEAPEMLDLRWTGETRFESLSFFCGGLPFHRRFGLRHLDTILIPRGESERHFRWGIGVDIEFPMPHAMAWCADETPQVISVTKPPATSVWLVHLSSPHVVVLRWEQTTNALGEACWCLTLAETEGRATSATLRWCRPIRSAARVTLDGTVEETLTISDNGESCRLTFPPHGVVVIDVVV